VQALTNAKGLYGVGKDADVRVFISNGAITAGQTVSLDETATGEDRAKKIVQGAADALVIGVALEAATGAGSEVRVCVGGYVEGVKTDGNVAQGNALVAKAAGALGPYANSDTTPILGVALETDDSTPVCDVYLFRLIP